MFSTSVRAALLALAATASAVAAAPGLSLKVTGADAVDGVENFKVTATLTNTGDETLKLLNDPRSALHTLPADTFAITTDDGARPGFAGVRVKYSLTNAAKLSDPSVFTVLAPGQNVSVTHDLSSAYDFTSTGHGKYTVGASDLFHVVGADGQVSELRAAASPHVATLASGALAAAARPSLARVAKRAQFTGCSADQQAALNAAAPAAQSYAAGAVEYLQENPAASSRYTQWFGAFTADRYNTVGSHFASISSHDYTTFTYDCTCTDTGVYAFVDPNIFGVIHLCGAFWRAPGTGADSQAGTLIHEASHFTVNGGTQDYVYGESKAQALAQSNPDEAIFNADNHEYFAEAGL